MTAKKVQCEQEFERHEEKVRETTEKMRKEKEGFEGQLHPMVNQFNKTKYNIESRKQEMMAIEGKSNKIRAELETFQNHINLNSNKVRQAEDDILNRRRAIEQIDLEQKMCDGRLQELRE